MTRPTLYATRAGRAIAFTAVALTIAACRDVATAPTQQHIAPSAPNYNRTPSGEISSGTFVIDPSVSQTAYLSGIHSVSFPAGSVCDMSVSSYGPSEWDRPCTPATSKITISFRSWYDSDGEPMVEFQPALRFVPTKTVTLQLKYKGTDAFVAHPTILYCADGSPICIDESLTDATLVTQYSMNGHIVSRRIKHFSGYVVSMGFADASVGGGF